MRGKGYLCLTTLAFNGRKSTHKRIFPFLFVAGMILEQKGDVLFFIISLSSKSSTISRI